MTEVRLKEIEARAAAVGSDTTLAKLLVITRQDIPDLVAALREAWARIAQLEARNRAFALALQDVWDHAQERSWSHVDYAERASSVLLQKNLFDDEEPTE